MINRTTVTLAALVSVGLVVAGGTRASAATNLLTNGNFETSGTKSTNGTIPGWSHGANSSFVIGVDSAANHDKYVILDSKGTNNNISTMNLSLTGGTTYVLTYDFGAAKNTTIAQNDLLVTLFNSNKKTSTSLAEDKIAGTTPLVADSGGLYWKTYSFTFKPTASGTMFLNFGSKGTTGTTLSTAYLDNVSLAVKPVPEAGTMGVFAILAAGGVILMRRRQKSITA
jgi:hypothetical protein